MFPQYYVLFHILIFSLFSFFLTAVRSPYCNMHLNTVKSITGWQDLASEWHSDPIVKHGNTDVQLCHAVGPDACPPDDCPGQPSLYPRHSLYQFDSNCYHGAESRDSLISMLKHSCPGCTLFLQQNDTKNHMYQLRCNHYPTQHHSSQKFSDPERFTKDNVVPITNKRSQSHSQSAFQRMRNPKM